MLFLHYLELIIISEGHLAKDLNTGVVAGFQLTGTN